MKGNLKNSYLLRLASDNLLRQALELDRERSFLEMAEYAMVMIRVGRTRTMANMYSWKPCQWA